jgi:hypothetical protein
MAMNAGANDKREPSPSEHAKAVIQELKLGEHNLDVSKLPKSSETVLDARRKSGELASFDFPRKNHGVDAYSYTIYVDQARKEYWVQRKGGVRPVLEIFGPAKLPASS